MNQKCKMRSLIFILVSLLVCPTYGQRRSSIPLKHGAHRVGIRTDQAMNRWRSHGLGQFIHWGVYAIPGGHWNGERYNGAAEWIRSWSGMPNQEYDQLYKEFNPVDFDAKRWAKQAKEMGAKYLIFTTKHHDGFCLWPSRYTDYTVANSPFKRDIVGEIVDAYNAEGIDVILYFSIIDWNHKGYQGAIPKTDADKKRYEEFKQFTRNQLLELLDNYPTIKGLWFDGTWDAAWVNEAAWADALGQEMRTKIPGLIIGSRFRADENGKRHYDTNGDLIDDYDQTWERALPERMEQLNGADWDCVMTVPENQWGYHSDWTGYVKTSDDLIQMIAHSAAMNGNFVLNFGPDGKGNIRPEETKLAAEIGEWMKVNGEAIYGASYLNWKKQGWGYYTQKENKVNLIVFNRPLNNLLRVEVPKGAVKPIKAYFLENGKEVELRSAGRNKFNANLYDVVIPAKYAPKKAFTIVLDLGDYTADGADYQQAKI